MKRLILLTLILSLTTSCAWMTRTEYKYVKPPIPKMKRYEAPVAYDLGTLYKKEGKVCIKKWDVCIPTEDFKEFIAYPKALKAQLKKANAQSDGMNILIEKFKTKGPPKVD